MSIKIYEKVIAELKTLRLAELAEANSDPARVAIVEQRHAEAVKFAKSIQADITEISGRCIASEDERNAIIVVQGIIERVEQLLSEPVDTVAAIKKSRIFYSNVAIGAGVVCAVVGFASYIAKKAV